MAYKKLCNIGTQLPFEAKSQEGKEGGRSNDSCSCRLENQAMMKILNRPISRKKLALVAGPLAFLIILLTGPYQGMSQEALAVLASTAWIAIWWISEAIPIPVTSLLPLVLFPLTGGLDLASTGAAFGNKIIFLYLGGFLLAIAIERWNLHRRIALYVITLFGTAPKKMILGFMVATGFLSMWISNTATAVMMLPIGLALVQQIGCTDSGPDSKRATDNFGKVLMLGIAYSASIGGMGTLIGTPPNLVLAGVVSEIYGLEIGFTDWMLFAIPISVVLLLLCWYYLVNHSFELGQVKFEGGGQGIKGQLAKLGRMGHAERTVLVVFVLTALAWISRSFLLNRFMPALDDTIIAIVAAIMLFVLPSGNREKPTILDWGAAKKVPWGIMLLFGGGLAIAAAFESSGLATWIAGKLSVFEGVSLALLLLALIALVNFLTEITSNTATTSMILPILAPIALTMGVHPFGLMFGAAMAASCAFMLPVATPPNAVVFGSGYLRMSDMIKTGVFLNLLSIVLLFLFVYFALPWIWGIDLLEYPMALKAK